MTTDDAIVILHDCIIDGDINTRSSSSFLGMFLGISVKYMIIYI